MPLIYCSYSKMTAGIPHWVEMLKAHPLFTSNSWTLYDSGDSFVKTAQNKSFLAALAKPPLNLSDMQRQILRLSPSLFEAPDKVSSVLTTAESNWFARDLEFRDLYLLLRSDIILADLNSPSFGSVSMEILYGYLMDIPVIGVCHKVFQTHWVTNKLAAMVAAKSAESLINIIIANGILPPHTQEPEPPPKKASKSAQRVKSVPEKKDKSNGKGVQLDGGS